MHLLKNLFYITSWLPSYRLGDLRRDAVAGLTVGIMLIPQGMAYAILGGLPPIYGLYASVVPLLVYTLLGSSQHLAIGITAIDMLIVVGGLSLMADPGSTDYIQLAFLLALLVGVIQMAMGAARLGFVVNLLSRPVIVGFTAAAALIIAASQVQNLLNLPLPRTQNVQTIVWEAIRLIPDIHLVSLAIGGGGIVVLLALRRWVPAAPGPLVVVLLATLAVWYGGLFNAGVEIVGNVPTGLPTPTLPSLEITTVRDLLPTAITLALVQFMSVISLGKLFAAKHRYTIKPNRELFALGALNFAGGIFRSMPVSGSFSRSAVGEAAGGRTALTNAFAAVAIILTLLFLTPLFYYLPIPAFSSIIIVAAIGMIDVRQMRLLFSAKRVDGGIAILTFLSTLIIGIHQGVLIGIAASVVAIMYRISYPHVAVLGHLSGTRSFRDTAVNSAAEAIEGILMLRVDASFSFANAELLKDLILQRSQNQKRPVHAVIIDANSMNDLDTTAAAVLDSVARTLHEREIELYFAGTKEPVLRVMRNIGLYDAVGADHFFLSPHRAVIHVLRQWGGSDVYEQRVERVLPQAS